MDKTPTLTDIERGDESCILRFSDDKSFQVEYLAIRIRCQCAKCKPRQENEQRKIEFYEEVSRLVMEKPMIEPVGHYGITMIWPSGCSSGIHSFSHLRSIAEESGTVI